MYLYKMKETISTYPKTKEEAVKRILSILTEESKETIKNTPEEKLILFHFSLGMFIRNELGLWKGGNKELSEDCCDEPSYYYDPDHVSGIIIDAIWERLKDNRAYKKIQ